MDTKRPSGHANRKARKVRDAVARGEEAERVANGEPAHLAQFQKAGPPPIGDPVAGVAWANDVAMMMLEAVLKDPVFPFEKRLRYASDFIGKMGLLHSKAHMQKRLADLEKAQEEEEAADGLETNPFNGASPT